METRAKKKKLQKILVKEKKKMKNIKYDKLKKCKQINMKATLDKHLCIGNAYK